MAECIFCSRALRKLKILKYNYWTIYLNDNQYYLGRIYVTLNRHGPENTLSLNGVEWGEFKSILDKVTLIVGRLFEVDLFNYLVLQNKDRNHFHMHVIPRYQKERRLNEEVFRDESWGKPPFPSPNKKINEETFNMIKKLILEGFG